MISHNSHKRNMLLEKTIRCWPRYKGDNVKAKIKEELVSKNQFLLQKSQDQSEFLVV